MQHRQTSELGPFVSWSKIPTIVLLEDGKFALTSSGTNALAINNALVSPEILLVEPNGLSKKPGEVTRQRP
jgi:hypothetical protein